jgi:hypothetical protein
VPSSKQELSRSSFWCDVNATRFITATLGLLLALGGFDHGFFEFLQGNAQTGGLFIHSIGARNQMWAYGTEDALTLLPTFMASGIAAMSISLLIAVWSIGFVHKRKGSLVFLLLSVALFLVGGGVAQVVYFLLAWALSTRIDKPFTGLGASLHEAVRGVLGRSWLWFLAAFALVSLFALEIAIAGYVPGVSDPKLVLHTCWSLLGVGLGFLLLAIVFGLLHDADRQATKLS